MKNTVNDKDTHYLTIDETTTTQDLQKEFNRHFPFLKIGFFRVQRNTGIADPENEMITTNEKIRDLQMETRTGKIFFTEKTTVRALEHSFSEEYGLGVQVFRKSGKVWLVTTSTDDWPLGEQNEEGKRLAHPLNIEKENTEDHDIY